MHSAPSLVIMIYWRKMKQSVFFVKLLHCTCTQASWSWYYLNLVLNHREKQEADLRRESCSMKKKKPIKIGLCGNSRTLLTLLKLVCFLRKYYYPFPFNLTLFQMASCSRHLQQINQLVVYNWHFTVYLLCADTGLKQEIKNK